MSGLNQRHIQQRIEAVVREARRAAGPAIERLQRLGLVPMRIDRRRRSDGVSLHKLMLAAAADKVEAWERAGIVDRVGVRLPSSRDLDAAITDDTGSPDLNFTRAMQILSDVIGAWQRAMALNPITPGADVALVGERADAEAAVDALARLLWLARTNSGMASVSPNP